MTEGLIRPLVMKPVAQQMSVDTTIYPVEGAPKLFKQSFDCTDVGWRYAMQLVKDVLDELHGEDAAQIEIVVRKLGGE